MAVADRWPAALVVADDDGGVQAAISAYQSAVSDSTGLALVSLTFAGCGALCCAWWLLCVLWRIMKLWLGTASVIGINITVNAQGASASSSLQRRDAATKTDGTDVNEDWVDALRRCLCWFKVSPCNFAKSMTVRNQQCKFGKRYHMAALCDKVSLCGDCDEIGAKKLY